MSHTSLFCVKCKSYTEAVGRHNVQLLNKRRALKGVCPMCATETYQFMPEDGKRETQLSLISSHRKIPSTRTPAKSVLMGVVPIPQEASTKASLDYLKYGLADKLLHYGVLFVIFGLSVVIGVVICAKFLH